MRTKSVIVDLSRSTANGCPSRLQCGYSKFRYTQTLYGGRWGSTSLGTSTFLMWNFNYSLSPGVCWNMIFICFSWNWELARLEFENFAKIVIWRWMIWKKNLKNWRGPLQRPTGPHMAKNSIKNSPLWPKMRGGDIIEPMTSSFHVTTNLIFPHLVSRQRHCLCFPCHTVHWNVMQVHLKQFRTGNVIINLRHP